MLALVIVATFFGSWFGIAVFARRHSKSGIIIYGGSFLGGILAVIAVTAVLGSMKLTTDNSAMVRASDLASPSVSNPVPAMIVTKMLDASSLVGDWACTNGNNLEFFQDGTFRLPPKPNYYGDTPDERTAVATYGNYKIAGSELSLTPDHMDMVFDQRDLQLVYQMINTGVVKYIRPPLKVRMEASNMTIVNHVEMKNSGAFVYNQLRTVGPAGTKVASTDQQTPATCNKRLSAPPASNN